MHRNKNRSKELAGYIENLKKTSAKNNQNFHSNQLKNKERDLSQQRNPVNNRRNFPNRNKSGHRAVRRTEKIIYNNKKK